MAAKRLGPFEVRLPALNLGRDEAYGREVGLDSAVSQTGTAWAWRAGGVARGLAGTGYGQRQCRGLAGSWRAGRQLHEKCHNTVEPTRMGVGYAPAAPVAKLDKAPVYETGDCWFESSRVRQPDPTVGFALSLSRNCGACGGNRIRGKRRRQLQGDLLVEGVGFMLVGMGCVFAFLLILVFATMALSAVAQRLAVSWPTAAEVGGSPTLEEAAAIAAALHWHRR